MGNMSLQAVLGTKTINVKNIMNLTQLDIAKLSDKGIEKAARVLSAAANKRVQRLKQYKEKTGIEPPALASANKRGKFVVTSKSPRSAFMKAYGFVQMKTSTVKGWKEYEKKTEESFESQFGITMSYEQRKKFWDAVERFKEFNKESAQYSSSQIQNAVLDNYDTETGSFDFASAFDQIKNDGSTGVNSKYENDQKQYHDASSFFTVGKKTK